ncbi:MAG: OmpA family protein [Parvibaculaceae bacterium]
MAALISGGWTHIATAQPIDAEPLAIPGDTHGMTMGNDEPLAAPDAAPADTTAPAPSTPLPDKAVNFDPANLPNPAPALISITFDDGSANLSDQTTDEIKAFANRFKESGGRVSLKGYAGPAGSTGSNERRLSLRRVLAVREILLAQGIKADRLEVRALGGVMDNGPADRVDITKSGH